MGGKQSQHQVGEFAGQRESLSLTAVTLVDYVHRNIALSTFRHVCVNPPLASSKTAFFSSGVRT